MLASSGFTVRHAPDYALGGAYIAGQTLSSNFPSATNPFIGAAGYSDAFVVKIDD
jgi:hypothetical protein